MKKRIAKSNFQFVYLREKNENGSSSVFFSFFLLQVYKEEHEFKFPQFLLPLTPIYTNRK